jgi:CubicO group peptidase (beta-lactamase class C family)
LLGWATAQAVIQSQQDKTSEITLETLLQEDVFDPLDMKDTTFLVPPEKKANVSVARKGVPMMIDWDFTSTFNPYFPFV